MYFFCQKWKTDFEIKLIPQAIFHFCLISVKYTFSSLYTVHICCTSGHRSVKFIKFADDTTRVGLILDGNESAYRKEVDRGVLVQQQQPGNWTPRRQWSLL